MRLRMDSTQYERRMKALKRFIRSKEWRKECAEFAVNLIQVRTRLGYGVNGEGQGKTKLKALSPAYKKFRKAHPPTGEASSPSKSNLTYTGDMLNAVTAKLTNSGIQVDLKNQKEREKALYNSINGRNFMFLSNAEVKQLQQFMELRLKEEFSKI